MDSAPTEAPREFTPPPLQAPTAKEKKYDRQLRLCAASGQRALEESHVLLVIGGQTGSNSSVAGAETLKNLVLPSIGNFTIADAATVAEADLGVNFFLERASLGRPRAEEMKRLLEELNPDVTGHAITQTLEEWLPQPDSLKPYNLFLICAPLQRDMLKRICVYARDRAVPVVYMSSVGLYATFALQVPDEFPIVDTHPDPDTIQDLRLLSPWAELEAEVSSQTKDLEAMSDHDHGHVPYILLLLHYLSEWKARNKEQPPLTFKEKTEFRSLVRSHARDTSSAGPEENYDEACAAVLKTITAPTIGSGTRAMFSLPACQASNLTSASSNFWITANAIQKFYDRHRVLPLPGSLPDMKATSASYIRLQNIYKSKARADVAEVTRTVRATETSLRACATDDMAMSEIEAFCKNAAHVKVLHGQHLPHLRLEHILPSNSHLLEEEALDELGEPSLYPIFHYFAVWQQQPQNHNFPPSDSHSSSSVSSKLKTSPSCSSTSLSLLSRALQLSLLDNPCCSGAELHNISSWTGGMVAQECLKLLTRQYVPVDNVVVVDGVKGRVAVMRL